jgi:hypothetical protein
MFKVPCVVGFESQSRVVVLHVPSVDVFVGLGGVTLEEIDVPNLEGVVNWYTIKGIPNVEVYDWSNVHPSEWSPELIQLNESYT